jgi:acyl-CoA thioester hydrolase
LTSPTPGTRARYRAFSTMTTRWFDNDVYGHMNNALHYQLFDTAVNGHLVVQGVLDPKTSPTVFLVVETGCSYFGEMGFPDVVHAGIHVTRLGTSSVTYGVGLFRNDDDAASAEGHFVHVNVDRETRRPVPISAQTRAVLKALRVHA